MPGGLFRLERDAEVDLVGGSVANNVTVMGRGGEMPDVCPSCGSVAAAAP